MGVLSWKPEGLLLVETYGASLDGAAKRGLLCKEGKANTRPLVSLGIAARRPG